MSQFGWWANQESWANISYALGACVYAYMHVRMCNNDVCVSASCVNCPYAITYLHIAGTRTSRIGRPGASGRWSRSRVNNFFKNSWVQTADPDPSHTGKALDASWCYIWGFKMVKSWSPLWRTGGNTWQGKSSTSTRQSTNQLVMLSVLYHAML